MRLYSIKYGIKYVYECIHVHIPENIHSSLSLLRSLFLTRTFSLFLLRARARAFTLFHTLSSLLLAHSLAVSLCYTHTLSLSFSLGFSLSTPRVSPRAPPLLSRVSPLCFSFSFSFFVSVTSCNCVATHRNALQHTAADSCVVRVSALQRAATRCNTLQHTATCYTTRKCAATHCN